MLKMQGRLCFCWLTKKGGLECSDGNSCDECKNGYDLNNNLCVSIIPNCEVLKNSNECQKCIENYAFKGDARNECLSIDYFNESFYTKDDGISYYLCGDLDKYCLKCYFVNEYFITNCYECKDGYVVFGGNSGRECFPVQNYQNNEEYFFVNYTFVEQCSSVINYYYYFNF